MDNNKTGFGKWYQKRVDQWIPQYCLLPLIFCFTLNSIIYWGAQILMRNAKHYDFTTDLDRAVPFVPAWILIYVGCYVFWGINYVLSAREGKKKCYQFVTADMISRLICGVFFILLPTTNIRPEVTGSDFCSALVRWIYANDAPTNLFPSIHCLVSWMCVIGIRRSRKVAKSYQIFSLIFAVLVCASTQFTKQHYLIDVAAGIAIAEICYWIAVHTNAYKKVECFFVKIENKVFG